MIFVDTSAWYADSESDDPNHSAARTFLGGSSESLLTTDQVIAETVTLLRARSRQDKALRVGRRLFGEELAQIEWVSRGDIRNAWDVFQKYRDKEWSFTDCVSFVVMERLRIKQAFTFDHHFKQFGTVEVVP